IAILRVEADAVVGDAEEPFLVLSFGGDTDDGSLVVAKLDCVPDEILKQLPELDRVTHDRRKSTALNFGAAFLDRLVERDEGAVENLLAMDRLEGFALSADAGIGQECVDKRLHALDTRDGVIDEVVGVGVELALVPAREQLRIARHHSERLLEIVR